MNKIIAKKSDLEQQNYPRLTDPVSGKRTDIEGAAGRIALYNREGDAALAPLLLIHSVNATPSAYEVKPLFDYYAGKRPVYALDLPGFGQSDRSDRVYTIKLMTDAIHAAVDKIRADHARAVDALALSLSCEFLARAALERQANFRTLAFVSPTGFERRARDDAGGGNRGMPWLHSALNISLWSRGLFELLTSRSSIKYFLKRTFGSQQIDQGLWDYAYLTTHQPGAQHAPYYFVSGYLFSMDALRLYEGLTHPVWMTHGVRGDFVDYRHQNRVEGRANWSFEVFPTGAFPHFETPDAFTRAYDGFLKRADETTGAARNDVAAAE
ncbi:alpha/beta hydrolase [uncultured Rhodoblastus sp.]|uniref:alpha/beta fold hydrolase n=1 Tax=uncultured Rhodoblastus sp. TaxID=543037 RepID=UPI0025F4C1A8|nr:alpha/beta hydrolase [uncultured Rhodoblastus sp.]